jgi:alkylation response protein AidB-like acyl-CoA dehydrogenase
MDFDFPAEQQALADALGRRLAARTPDEPAWAAVTELGVTSLAVAEAHGGFGGSAADLYLAFQCLGRQRATSPLWGTAVAAQALAWAGTARQQSLLPAIASGEQRIALAFGERALRHALTPVGVTGRLRSDGTQLQLQGTKTQVLFAEDADAWLVSAQVAAHTRLLLVPRSTPGVQLRPYLTFDGQPGADVCLDDACVDASCLLPGDDAGTLLQRLADYGAALLCAEAVGLMECAKDTTLDYLKTRQQFGRPLSEQQVLQHRMVDLLIHLEQARSMALLAAAHADSDAAVQRVRHVAAAKAMVGEAGRFVGQQSVQMHGAMGLTQECAVSGILKRLTAIDLSCGDTEHHLARLAELQMYEHDFA